ncbi:MAG: acyl-CoA dehydrogenase [Jatrophihabitans sp.]
MTRPALAAPTDLGPLRDLLDGRWHEVRERARDLAGHERFAPVHDLPEDEYRDLVMEQARHIAELGYPKLGFPEEYGGSNDVGASVTAFEMLAYGDLSLLVKAGVQWGLFGGAVLHLGTKRHHDAYLEDIISLALPGCFAMTETGHGSDVASIRTTATYDLATEQFVIDTPFEAARKDYIGNAARHGRMAAVFAQLITNGTCEGVHAFLVPIRDVDGVACPGVTIGDCGPKAGLGGVDNGRLSFAVVRVPREALLNQYGDVAADGTYTTAIAKQGARFFTMLGTLIQGRISVAGGAGSAARLALAIAIKYGEARRQFAAPGSDKEVVVMDYLAHQRKLLPLLAHSYAMHFAQLELVGTLHDVFTGATTDQHTKRELESRAAGIKAIGTWHATNAIQTAREACGGAGYLAENRLPSLKADTDVFTTFEGDNTVLLQLVAKELMTSYRTEFGSLDTLGMVRFVAEQFGSAVIERTAARTLIQRLVDAAPGRDEDADLLDRGHQLELFEWREKHVVNTLARRLRRIKPDSPGAFEQFNAVQDHLLTAARAHVDRVVLEAFVAAIDRCDDPVTATLLGRVCDLHVLSILEADRAWFIEHGRLTLRRSKAITPAVNALCAELRPHAALLVDAFGIPAAAISAPIAQGAEAARQMESMAGVPLPV